MRRGVNDLYNQVVSQDTSPPENGSTDSLGMTPQVQMQLVQAINKVLNPEKTKEAQPIPSLVPSVQQVTKPQMQ